MNTRILLFLALTTIGIIFSCQKDPDTPTQPTNPTPTGEYVSSWDFINKKILAEACVDCHSKGSTFARQSGLVLEEAVAYQNMVGVRPHNQAAREDGLFLLEQGGLSSLYTSFLWEKINAPDQEHFNQDHPEYGEMMPLGNKSLTNGELEYIRQWIVAGAPEDGFVADEEVLKDTIRFELPDENFEPLPLPANGYQMHLEKFEAQADGEREIYQFQPVGNTEEVYVNRFEVRMRKGSHHFILYDFPEGGRTPIPGQIRDIYRANGTPDFLTLHGVEDQIFVFGTQFREADYSLPEGVAIKVPANKYYDMNSHYVNYTENAVDAEVFVNLHTVDESEVEHVAEQLFLSKQNFQLPPNRRSTITSNWTFDERRHVFMLTSHAHAKMEEFRIYIKGGARDGELVYFTNDWEHPILLKYDEPITLERGEGLRGEAIYYNDTDETLRFGPRSTDEMNIIFGSYYTD